MQFSAIGSKPAWPCFPDAVSSTRIDLAVDYEEKELKGENLCDVTRSTRPLNIRFRCLRQAPGINPCMSKIYRDAIQGMSYQSLQRNTRGCLPGHVTGSCGNFRGSLTECACETLNRLSYPQLRHRYENEVILAALKIVKTNPDLKCLNLAIFASGGLHGELVLTLRLVEELKKNGFQGIIQLFLIDQQYQECIQKAYRFEPSAYPQPFPWVNFLGGKKDLAQFLSEISLCLPPTIQVTGAFFGDANDYIGRARANPNFRHDLLIGSDIGITSHIVSRLKLETQRRDDPGIMLIKESHVPKICHVKSISGNFHCTRVE